MKALRIAGVLVILAAVVFGLGVAVLLGLRSPSNDRAWAADQSRLPEIEVIDGEARVRGIRDFRHRADGSVEARWRDETYNLDQARRVWFALAPFASRYRGLAHSFLSFEFEDGRFLSVSVEARREVGEGYSLVGGLLQGFEVTYVVGTEEDLLGLRALRGDTLYLYPSVATPEQTRAIFVDMLARARALADTPEFYNTLTNNCTTNLRDHVNRVASARLPWGWGVLLPGFSDALALEHGLLDTGLDVQGARARFRVDDRVRRALQEGGEGFSRRIREEAGPRATQPEEEA